MYAYSLVGFSQSVCYDCSTNISMLQSEYVLRLHTHTQIYSLSPQFATKQTIDTSAISRVPSPPFSLISKFPCDSLFRSNTNTTTPNQLLFTGSLLNLHSPSLPVPLALFLIFLTCSHCLSTPIVEPRHSYTAQHWVSYTKQN